jgi:exopolyphosphatase/pppGpp-phosphohydrolase
MELLGAKRIGVSVRGLRYGVLTAAIEETEHLASSKSRTHLTHKS